MKNDDENLFCISCSSYTIQSNLSCYDDVKTFTKFKSQPAAANNVAEARTTVNGRDVVLWFSCFIALLAVSSLLMSGNLGRSLLSSVSISSTILRFSRLLGRWDDVDTIHKLAALNGDKLLQKNSQSSRPWQRKRVWVSRNDCFVGTRHSLETLSTFKSSKFTCSLYPNILSA